MKTTTTTMVVAALAGSSLVGCHDAAPATTPANVAPAHPGFAGDDLSLVPSTSALVVGVDWAQLRNTIVYTQLAQPKVDGMAEIQMLRSTCGFDPLAAMTSVTFASASVDRLGEDTELVVRGIPRDRVLACMPKLVTSAPPTTKIHQDGDTWVIAGDGPPTAVRFVADATAVVVVGARASAAGIDALLAGGATAIPTSPGFTELRDKVRGHTELWFVANLAAKPSPDFPGATAAFGGIDVTDGIALDTTVRFSSEDAAANSAQQLKGAAGQLGAFTDKLDIAANGKDLVVAAAMGHTKLMMLMSMTGMGGGGGGGGAPPAPPHP